MARPLRSTGITRFIATTEQSAPARCFGTFGLASLRLRLFPWHHRTGSQVPATDLGVPRSTARGWLGAAPTVVVYLDGADLTEPELRQEVLKLRRRVQKLTALLRLALALL